MLNLIRSGHYKLIETRHQTKVLYLDDEIFAWLELLNIGEILVASRKEHKTDCVISAGRYRIYDVEDEPALSDHVHMELECGNGIWQGYLLLSGLPKGQKKRGRIIPTKEIITTSPVTRDSFTPETAMVL